ncbi:Uncharacterized protein TCM_014559 [Theobroma cacao]|uniref:Uncharacterized protein n=1 Tax=Theobroma cacao TaxID=3641 RepID=A0A061FZ74_THECC|nr:Uncharacterized protein TCM_014559 [Theobroma cacao]
MATLDKLPNLHMLSRASQPDRKHEKQGDDAEKIFSCILGSVRSKLSDLSEEDAARNASLCKN